MSVFAAREIACGRCGARSTHDVALSVNAGRSPQHYQAVLEGTFHRMACPHCGAVLQVELRFNWVDFGRRHFFSVWPAGAVGQWAEAEHEIADAFDRYMAGPQASAIARSLSQGFAVRVVFGLPALREKLVCHASGLDDRALALLVLLVMRDTPALLTQEGLVPRLVSATEASLLFSVPGDGSTWELPRSRYDEACAMLAGDPHWISAVAGGAWVDANRALLGNGPTAC